MNKMPEFEKPYELPARMFEYLSNVHCMVGTLFTPV